VCKSIGDVLGLKFPYNVQFRIVKGKNYDNIGNLRLLEINPRMSGGLYYEVLCGMNIAEICMLDNMEFENKGTQCDYSKFINFKDCYVTHVEKAIKVDI
jgi:carbamoylphosphate synthase large subunit